MPKHKHPTPEDLKKNFFESDKSLFFEGGKQESSKPERVIRTVTPNVRSVKANGSIKRTNTAPAVPTSAHDENTLIDASDTSNEEEDVLTIYKNGPAKEKERTKRESFEIYPSQKRRLEDMQHTIKKKTGKKVSLSLFVRSAINDYLKKFEE